MKKIFRRFLGLIGLSLALTSHAAFALTAGQQLSQEQIAKWGTLAEYDIGGSRIRVIPSQASGSQDTLLINAQGVVGSSRNEVAISDAPTQDIRAQLKQTLPQPVSVQHYEPTGLTVLRYADFEQAVAGLRALKKALPAANIRLPVQFGKQVPY